MKRLIVILLCIGITISTCGCSNNNTKRETTTTDEAQKNNDTLKSVFTLADYEKVYGNTFGQGNVININIELSEEDWKDICDNAEKEEYHSANITVNGTTLSNVGFRTKGFYGSFVNFMH